METLPIAGGAPVGDYASPAFGWARIASLAVFLAVAGAVAWGLHQEGLLDPEHLKTAIAGMGPWAPIAFIGIGITFVLLAMPSWTATVVAGYLFGPLWGAIFAVLAATTGATLAFLIARGIGRGAVQARLGRRLRRLDEGLAARGFRYMLAIRLLPLLPFTGISYGAGVTRIRFGPYVLATLLGCVPMAAVYAYLGSSAGALLPAVLRH